MKARYGPYIDGIRLVPEPEEDEGVFKATTHAGYTVGTLVAAHDPESGLAQAMFDAQGIGLELRQYVGIVESGDAADEEHTGVYATVPTVAAATLATTFAPERSEQEEMEKAAQEWRSVYDEIVSATSQDARHATTNRAREVPDAPWE